MIIFVKVRYKELLDIHTQYRWQTIKIYNMIIGNDTGKQYLFGLGEGR